MKTTWGQIERGRTREFGMRVVIHVVCMYRELSKSVIDITTYCISPRHSFDILHSSPLSSKCLAQDASRFELRKDMLVQQSTMMGRKESWGVSFRNVSMDGGACCSVNQRCKYRSRAEERGITSDMKVSTLTIREWTRIYSPCLCVVGASRGRTGGRRTG